MNPSLRLLALSTVLLGFASLPALAQEAVSPDQEAVPPDQEEEEAQSNGDIIVTGSMRVRQGGAQDIRHFRSMAAEVGMPRPESLSLEGLMGEHDLTLPASTDCARLFCLVAEAMAASLPTRPDDRLIVGLGFASNIDAATWHRAPLNLVAVVDKSGSMMGRPLDLVRKSLRQIVGQMRNGDQLSIVLYGDRSHLYLAPTPIGRDREAVLRAIDNIESAGSTNMEAGLRVGFDTAFGTREGFAGSTRLMLFTDEQPNVGNTDAASFMGMADAASRLGIGLTTVGVGVQFDGALATKVSSVRGGNLFFIANEDEVKSVFEKQLDTMVSELAHDVRITMTPRQGYKLTGVFGVPDGLMSEAPDGAVSITVPTAFLSTNGGGIFAALGKASERTYLPVAGLSQDRPLMEVSLAYVSALDGKPGADRLAVSNPAVSPSRPLRLAHLLIDEYFALREASTAFHVGGKPKEAHALLAGIARRLETSGFDGIGDEKKLVGDMLAQAALFSGYGGELPPRLRPLVVRGTWEVSRVEGIDKISRGDVYAFDEGDVTVRTRDRHREPEETEAYEINEKQIFFPRSGLAFDYFATGKQLTLSHIGGTARIYLRRVEADPST